MSLVLSKANLLGFGHGNLSYQESCGQALAKGVPLVYNIHGGFSSGYYILS